LRRKQFTQLISDVRAELRRNNDPGVRAADLPSIQQAIGRAYESLYDEYDWPHLRQVFARITLSAGERYYDFPDDMDFDRLEKVVVWQSSLPIPITRGIDFEEYAEYDSEADVRGDPVSKWDVRWQTTKEMIEVWPIPASNTQALQFVGITKFQQLVDDADLCRLDDNIVVLTAAISLETNKETKLEKQIALAARLVRVKGRSQGASGFVRIGLGAVDHGLRRGAVVRVSGR
jgi:hypothetical protein